MTKHKNSFCERHWLKIVGGVLIGGVLLSNPCSRIDEEDAPPLEEQIDSIPTVEDSQGQKYHVIGTSPQGNYDTILYGTEAVDAFLKNKNYEN